MFRDDEDDVRWLFVDCGQQGGNQETRKSRVEEEEDGG